MSTFLWMFLYSESSFFSHGLTNLINFFQPKWAKKEISLQLTTFYFWRNSIAIVLCHITNYFYIFHCFFAFLCVIKRLKTSTFMGFFYSFFDQCQYICSTFFLHFISVFNAITFFRLDCVIDSAKKNVIQTYLRKN